MSHPAKRIPETYFPHHTQTAEVIDIMDALKRRNPDVPDSAPRLVAGDGTHYELPDNIFQPLLLIAQSLVEGKAVSVAPMDQVLTTQEAADFLGVSRPTLVSLLEKGEIPFEKLNRHRRLKLSDVVEYRHRKSSTVRAGLRDLSRAEYHEGIAEATVGMPPAMR